MSVKPAFTYSKLTIETLEQGMKYLHQNDANFEYVTADWEY